ncbi:unnamed protein product, partial [Clonostachys solani]
RCWKRLHPRSSENRYRRFTKRREGTLLLKHPVRSSSLDLAQLRRNASQLKPKDKFFGWLPPEIRRRILVCAFGERTVHIDLSYTLITRPYQAGYVGVSAARTHAGLLPRSDYHQMYDGEWQWQWYGCVCHRSGPEEMTLSLGRFRSSPGIDRRRFTWTACLEGGGVCQAWPGNQPDKCRLECLGWLLTSKQAYIEGMEVIYGTNTINFSSSEIMLSSPSILPPNILRSIRSLELAIDTQRSPLKYAFRDPEFFSPSLHTVPIFPSLLYLRISLFSWDLDIWFRRKDLLHHYGPNRELWLQLIPANVSIMLHRIDSFLERIAPPTAEVTVDWNLTGYDTLSNVLLSERLDQASLHIQEYESGGRKYWRQTSTSIANIPTGDTNCLGITGGPGKRQGYWIYCDEAEDDD